MGNRYTRVAEPPATKSGHAGSSIEFEVLKVYAALPLGNTLDMELEFVNSENIPSYCTFTENVAETGWLVSCTPDVNQEATSFDLIVR